MHETLTPLFRSVALSLILIYFIEAFADEYNINFDIRSIFHATREHAEDILTSGNLKDRDKRRRKLGRFD